MPKNAPNAPSSPASRSAVPPRPSPGTGSPAAPMAAPAAAPTPSPMAGPLWVRYTALISSRRYSLRRDSRPPLEVQNSWSSEAPSMKQCPNVGLFLRVTLILVPLRRACTASHSPVCDIAVDAIRRGASRRGMIFVQVITESYRSRANGIGLLVTVLRVSQRQDNGWRQTPMSPRRCRIVVWGVPGVGTLRCRCWLHGQWPLQDHLDPGADGQGNFIAAREPHFGQAKPGANQSTRADANADMADRSDKNAGAGCLGHGVDVGINLVHWFQRAFLVDRPVSPRSR